MPAALILLAVIAALAGNRQAMQIVTIPADEPLLSALLEG